MPTADGAGKLVVPYQPFGDIHEEYVTCCARADGRYQPLGLEQARKIWSSSPVLHHVKLARPKLNFQRCSTCVGLETAIRSAARKGNRYPNKNSNPNPNPNPNPRPKPKPKPEPDRDELRQKHHERRCHLQLQMEERCIYYQRRWR